MSKDTKPRQSRPVKRMLPRQPGPWMGAFEWAVFQTIERAAEAWSVADGKHKPTLVAIVTELIDTCRHQREAVESIRYTDLQDSVARMVLESFREGEDETR